MNTLADNIANLEHDMKLFPPEQDVAVTVWVRVNEDVPAGFVEVKSGVSDYSTFEKIVDAQAGRETKSIRLLIHE